MINDKTKSEILSSILIDGVSAEENKTKNNILNPNSDHLISYANGLPQIKKSLAVKFELALKPSLAVNPLELRCCLCNRVINFPAWYLGEEMALNTLHFFICFTGANKPEYHK